MQIKKDWLTDNSTDGGVTFLVFVSNPLRLAANNAIYNGYPSFDITTALRTANLGNCLCISLDLTPNVG